MDDFLSNPGVQGGVAPFAVALVVALALSPLRLGGLTALAGFLTAMYFVSGFQLTPLTATRKILLLAVAATLVGMLVDFAFKPTRIGATLLALGAAASVLWVFWRVLAQKPAAEGAGRRKSAREACDDPRRLLQKAATAAYGMYAIALAAGAGAFLLPQMIIGKKAFAGATFTLTAMLVGGLVAAGAMILAMLPWYSALALALVPLGARLPVPERAPVWLQAVLLSLYGFIIGAAACLSVWRFPDASVG